MIASTPAQNITTDTSIHYGKLFRRTLGRAVQKSLDDVCTYQYTVPEEVRTQAWHMLKLLFEGDELWEETSELLIELAPRMEMAGFREDWIPFLESGIIKSTVRQDGLTQAKLLYYLGQLCRLIGRYDEAWNYLEESEEIYVAHNKANGQALVLNEMAFITSLRGNYSATKDLAEYALRLFDGDHPERAMSYYHLGRVAELHADWDWAKRNYDSALNIRRYNGDLRWIVSGLRNLGKVHAWQGNYDEAIARYNEALQLHENLSDPVQQASTLISLGIALRRCKEYSKAIKSYEQAETFFKKVSDQDGLATTYNNLSMVYKDLEQWKKAIGFAKRAINMQKLVGNTLRVASATETLGEVYLAKWEFQMALGKFEEALKFIQHIPNFTTLDIYTSLKKHVHETNMCIVARD